MDPDCDDDDDEANNCDNVAVIKPVRVDIHNGYKSVNQNNEYSDDIAILQLQWEPRESEIIRNINLPNSSDCSSDKLGNELIFTGFGE